MHTHRLVARSLCAQVSSDLLFLLELATSAADSAQDIALTFADTIHLVQFTFSISIGHFLFFRTNFLGLELERWNWEVRSVSSSSRIQKLEEIGSDLSLGKKITIDMYHDIEIFIDTKLHSIIKKRQLNDHELSNSTLENAKG